jgi:hypothetical protein
MKLFFSVKVHLHKRDESLGDAIYLKIAIASDGDNMYYIFGCGGAMSNALISNEITSNVAYVA